MNVFYKTLIGNAIGNRHFRKSSWVASCTLDRRRQRRDHQRSKIEDTKSYSGSYYRVSPVIVFSIINPNILSLKIAKINLIPNIRCGAAPTNACGVSPQAAISRQWSILFGCYSFNKRRRSTCWQIYLGGQTCCAGAQPTTGGTSGMNIQAAIAKLDADALPGFTGYCARYVRFALLAGGFCTLLADLRHMPKYGPILLAPKFTQISSSGHPPQAGDNTRFL